MKSQITAVIFSFTLGEVIGELGRLRVEDGLLDDADDLLQEALDLAEVTHSTPQLATVLFYIASLR